MKFKLILALFLSSFVLFNSCGDVSAKRSIKLAHGLDVNHSVHKAMVKMGEDLAEISEGKMQLEIYPSQQLGTERECIELLQIGSLDMTKVSVGVMENFAPKMKVFGLPFLFRDRAHSFQVLDGPIGQDLLDEGTKYWIKGLGYYDAGSRSFYTSEKAIRTPDDLKGLKIRVMNNQMAINMVNSMGGSATPLSYSELYTAIQQGVVDGAENNPPSFVSSNHYEISKYYTLDQHSSVPDVLLIGTKYWEKLSEEEKKWVQDAADTSAQAQKKFWNDSVEESMQIARKAGVEIIIPDKSLFAEKSKSVLEAFEKEYPEMAPIVSQIKSQ